MTRSEVRDFIESGVNELIPTPEFGSGRVSEWNSKLNKSFPSVWLESLSTDTALTATLNTPFDSWNVSLHIGKLDKPDSTADQYETIVDECDLMAQKLITLYNQLITGYSLLTIENIGREPFIKRHADCITGVLLTFNLVAADTTDTCPQYG